MDGNTPNKLSEGINTPADTDVSAQEKVLGNRWNPNEAFDTDKSVYEALVQMIEDGTMTDIQRKYFESQVNQYLADHIDGDDAIESMTVLNFSHQIGSNGRDYIHLDIYVVGEKTGQTENFIYFGDEEPEIFYETEEEKATRLQELRESLQANQPNGYELVLDDGDTITIDPGESKPAALTRGFSVQRTEKGGFSLSLPEADEFRSFSSGTGTLEDILEEIVGNGNNQKEKQTLMNAGYSLETPRETLQWSSNGDAGVIIFSKDLSQKGIVTICEGGVEILDFSEVKGGVIRVRKPVIYMYSEEEKDVNIGVHLNRGTFSFVYPKFSSGNTWTTTIKKDCKVKVGDSYYPYLFWEAETYNLSMHLEDSFCIKGKNVVEFLESTLEKIGLNSTEKVDFITYWGPLLECNEFNIISFNTREYEAFSHLEITPKPDFLHRVFMTYAPSLHEVKTGNPVIQPTKRPGGFTIVEWGGAEGKILR